MGRPALRKQAVAYVMSHYCISQRRACTLIKMSRSTLYYLPVRDPRPELRRRMKELAQIRIRYCYRRLHVLLKREGWQLGRKQCYRIYREEELQLRSKLPKRRKMVVQRRQRHAATRQGEVWSMDFVADQFGSGGKFRILTVVDVFTRQALAVDAGLRLKGEHVVETLNRLVRWHGPPKVVFVDNGSEFTGRLMDMWAYHHGVRLDFSRPGKPTDNSFVETFNGTLRDECLNLNWFASLTEAQRLLEAWRRDYNESRPHSALEYLTPAEYARKIKELEPA